MTYLTVPIAAENLEQAKALVKAALAAGAGMLELRTDYLENLSVPMVGKLIADTKTAAGRKLPVIVTCRDKQQGGAKEHPLKLRIDVLAGALKAGAEYIDFEYDNFAATENQEKIRVALSQSGKGRLILSAHNFQTRFENIARLYRRIQTAHPAAIPKLVYTANHINDCFDAFDLLQVTSGERIIFCMGQAGLISRVLAKKFDTFLTFASIDEKTATAPGQLTIEQFHRCYRYDSINSETQLYGIIGSPVGHSLGPIVHNACFEDAGANKLYLPLLVDGGGPEFEKFMGNILARKWLGFRGFSVTIPHKENALEFIRQKQGFVEPLARKIGAVNTIVITADGLLKAYNTDYAGALDAIATTLGAKVGLKNMPAAVIGAGGVARAIVAGLCDAGAKITIYNRTAKKGEKLAAEFGCCAAPLDELRNLEAKLLINCTSVGMYPDVNATPIPKQYIKKGMVVFDTVYNPPETLLLKQAKEIGAKTISGMEMFINQACGQFKLFTGQNGTPKVMMEAMKATLLGSL